MVKSDLDLSNVIKKGEFFFYQFENANIYILENLELGPFSLSGHYCYTYTMPITKLITVTSRLTSVFLFDDLDDVGHGVAESDLVWMMTVMIMVTAVVMVSPDRRRTSMIPSAGKRDTTRNMISLRKKKYLLIILIIKRKNARETWSTTVLEGNYKTIKLHF